MVEIRITYETLFDLLRREKNREELQKLDDDFYEQVFAYLKEKEDAINKKEDRQFLSAEKEKLKIQYQNIRRIVKELYEKREKKIINMAVVKARTGSEVIDTSGLLPSEKNFFEQQAVLIGRFKSDVLDNILFLKDQAGIADYSPKPVLAQNSSSFSSSEESYSESAVNGDSNEHHFAVNETASWGSDEKNVRFLVSLPKFMGKEGEVLGPFNEGDVAALDFKIAEVLVSKGRAEYC